MVNPPRLCATITETSATRCRLAKPVGVLLQVRSWQVELGTTDLALLEIEVQLKYTIGTICPRDNRLITLITNGYTQCITACELIAHTAVNQKLKIKM